MTTGPVSAEPLRQLQPLAVKSCPSHAGKRPSRRRQGKLNRCCRWLTASFIINSILLGPVTFGLYHLVKMVPSAQQEVDQATVGASAMNVLLQWLISTEWFVLPPSLLIGLIWLSPAMDRKPRVNRAQSSPAATPQSAGHV